jgi:Zn-dependent alcohol dehydrogenase
MSYRRVHAQWEGPGGEHGVGHVEVYNAELGTQGLFPCILGHEGGGVVESVGDDVTSVKVVSSLTISMHRIDVLM